MPHPDHAPDDDPLLKAFAEIAETLGEDPIFASLGAGRQPHEYSEEHESIVAACDTVYLQFRGDYAPIPIVRTPEELEAAVEVRCKTGLADLLQHHGDSPEVEYAGFALMPYRYPTDRFSFIDPEAAAALRHSTSGEGPDTESDANRQDYYLEIRHCFDIRMLDEQYPNVWKFGSYSQEDFSRRGYILGPIVRTETEEDEPDIDDFNQYDNMTFDPQYTVFIPGDVLLTMLQQRYSHLLHGGHMRESLPHMFLAEQYGLQAAIDRFHTGWVIRRQVWEAEHGENPGEE